MPRVLKIVLGAALLAILGYVLYELFTTPSMRSSSERYVRDNLKTLVTAEEDFRANDREKNGENDYWRGDVAGLYALIPKGETEKNPIKLIELSVAGADDRPIVDLSKYVSKMPKAGYWYRTLRKNGEPPIQKTQYAFCAFPAQYGKSGKVTLIIDNRNTVYQADLGHGRGIEVYPDEEELKRVWKPLLDRVAE